MKNRILSLLLVVVFAVSLCACGGSETGNKGNEDTKNTISEESTEIRIEENYTTKEGKIRDYAIFISLSEFKKHLKKVTLTKENWKEYFGDYEYTEHVVEKNAFGEIENEYDVVHKGFGGKNVIALNNVAFKFSSMKMFGDDGVTVEIVYPDNNEYFTVEMIYSALEDGKPNSISGINRVGFEASQCVDVIGEIIVWDFDISTLDRPSLYVATPDGKMIYMTTGIGASTGWDSFLNFVD